MKSAYNSDEAKNQINKRIGTAGENAACEFLISEGYTVTARNYRIGHDEIDIIAEKDLYTVFVEVKTRNAANSSRYGRPSSAVDQRKRACLARVADGYIKRDANKGRIYRFDVIEVTVCTDGITGRGSYRFNHMKSVFGRGGKIM